MFFVEKPIIFDKRSVKTRNRKKAIDVARSPVKSYIMARERTGKTNERTTVVDTNSLASRGLLTLKKTIPGTKKKFLAI